MARQQRKMNSLSKPDHLPYHYMRLIVKPSQTNPYLNWENPMKPREQQSK